MIKVPGSSWRARIVAEDFPLASTEFFAQRKVDRVSAAEGADRSFFIRPLKFLLRRSSWQGPCVFFSRFQAAEDEDLPM
jgi:hypothetical protein